MNFGLNLVLSLTDRASAGMERAASTLNQLTTTAENAAGQFNEMASLTAFSAIADRVGSGMISVGSTILSTFSQVINKVNETGRTLMYAENQLGKLYESSGKTGKEVIGQIADYAKTSIFEFEDLIPVVTMLKANGIEAFDSIASSTGNANQTLMDYAADLAAFNPQMRNAYGTGIRAAMGALSEYIAEGNAMSLKRGASLDITALLGEDKGKTIEERSRQVADLMEKLNMVGMTAQMANSPITKLSNMQDTLFQFIGKVSDSGVYDTYTRIIDVFAGFVNTISDERLQNIASIVGDALSSLMKPIEKLASVVTKAADSILKFIENNPKLAKFATIATAVSGALMLIGGVGLKFAASIGRMTLMLKSFSTSFSTISSVLKMGSKKILGSLLPLTLALGTMYLAWKYDLFGIKTIVTDFVTNVSNSFKKANDGISGDVNHMKEVIASLDKNNAFDNLTLGIMKLRIVLRALKEGWNGFTLSEDTFLKAKELGVLPLIQAFFDLKYRFDQFKQGFIAGWEELKNKVVNAWNKITSVFKGTFIGDALDKLTSFLQKLTGNDPEAWYNAGKTFSKVAAGLIALWGAVKLFKGVSKIFGAGKSVAGGIGKLLGFGGKNKGGLTGTSDTGFLSNPKKVLKTMGSLAIILGGATLLVTAIGAFMSIPHFKDFASAGFDSVKQMFENLIPLGATIGGLGLLAKGFEVLKISPKTAAKGIADFAILLGGMDVLITAMGALNSIPGFDNFLNTGVDVINRLFGVLKSMFDIEILTTIGLIGAFGFVPVKTAASGIANLSIILGGLDVLITAMGALNSIEGFDDFLNRGVDTINQLFGVLQSMFDISILGTVGAISAFGLVPVGVTVTGLGNLALVLTGMTGIISAFSALGSIEGFDDFIDRGGDTLAKLFGQVGKIVGEVVAQFGESATSTLPSIGENLSGFMTKAETFFTQIQEVDTDKVSSFMTSFADLAGTLTGDKLVSLLTGETDYAELGTKLSDFGTNSKGFFDTVKDFPDEAFTNAGKMFAALNGLDQYSFKSGGIAQLFTGEVAFDKIGEQMNSFTQSGALDFFTQIEGISDNAFSNAEKLFSSLSGLDAYEFKSGGLAQLFTGEVAFDKIGEQMNSFVTGGALDFFTSVEGVSDTAFDNANKLFESLNGLDAYQFKSGGLAQFFTGDVAFDKIGAQLKSFSDVGATDFFTSMEGISETSFDNASKLFETLNGLDAYQFKSGGLAQLITGDTAFDKIGAQLKTFASYSGDFFTQMSGLSPNTFTNVDSLFKSLEGLDKYEFKTGGIAQWFTGEVNFGNIGTNLGDFARNSEDFFTKIGTYDESTFTKVNSAMGVFDALGKNKAGLELFSGRGAIFGGNNAANVGRNLSDFARESETFFTKMANINTEAVSNFSTAIDALSDLSYIHNTGNLTAMGDDLSKCAEAIGGFVSVFKGESFDVSALTTVTESITSLSTSISTVNTDVGTAITSITTNLTSLGTSFTEMSTNAGTAFSTMASTISTTMSTIYLGLNTQWNSIISYTATAGASMVSAASSAFNSMKASISSIMSSAVSTVKSSVSAMESAVAGMTFKVSQTHIALPHFKASGSFSANPPSVPTFSVSWYKKGGIFDNPSIIGVGEQGKEAVMPLEKNTQWIGILADRISNALESSSVNLNPVNTTPVGKTPSDAPITRNVSNTTYGGDTDNSVVFQNGAIQLNCQNTSEEEAMRLAKKIMYYIERQTQLKSMAMYNT